MSTTRVSGKKLVWVGGLVLLCAAASARIFAVYYLHDSRAAATSQPTTEK